MKKMKLNRIVKYIDDFGSITTLEAMRDLGVTNLHTRLCYNRHIIECCLSFSHHFYFTL